MSARESWVAADDSAPPPGKGEHRSSVLLSDLPCPIFPFVWPFPRLLALKQGEIRELMWEGQGKGPED